MNQNEKPNHFPIMVLVALAASGKSELIKFMMKLLEEMRQALHIGRLCFIDDFPIVDLMRAIDAGLVSLGWEPLFFLSPTGTFKDKNKAYRALIQMINFHYVFLTGGGKYPVEPKLMLHDIDPRVQTMLALLEEAWAMAGGRNLLFNPDGAPLIGEKDYTKLCQESLVLPKVASIWEKRCHQLVDIQGHEAGVTFAIEFARGGEWEQPVPLPYGYGHSFPALCSDILKSAVFMHLKVHPITAMVKNAQRFDPTNPESTLGHMVPAMVQMSDYGSDDFLHLLKNSSRPGCIDINVPGDGEYLCPAASLDNDTKDLTTWVRHALAANKDAQYEDLPQAEREALYAALKEQTDALWDNYSKQRA